MSILDGLPKTEADAKQQLEIAAAIFETWLETAELTPKQRSIVELQKEGLSLANIMGLTKQHREAMFIQAYRLLEAGEVAKAQDAFLGLIRLEPTDPLPHYAIGATYQQQGDFATAGKFFVQFLGLDATNGAGYLRLGECLMANNEINEARDAFGVAKMFAAKSGDAETAEQAEKLISALAAR